MLVRNLRCCEFSLEMMEFQWEDVILRWNNLERTAFQFFASHFFSGRLWKGVYRFGLRRHTRLATYRDGYCGVTESRW